MGGACGTLRVGIQMHTEFWCGNLYFLNDIGDGERIILKHMLKKEDGKDLKELMWLRAETTAVLWRTQKWISEFHKPQAIS
jgi:hypothetical protein